MILITGFLLVASCSSEGPPEETPGFQHDPDLAAIASPSGSELTVAFADPELQTDISADYIAGEWAHMRNCLAVDAHAPTIIVVRGWLDAVESYDVLFNIQGRRLATASADASGAHLIRISSYDFDGSQGNPGFHLRSILGRYLWARNELLASGYNTRCATRD